MTLGAADAPPTIRALRSRVTRAEAIDAFAGGLAGGARCLALGPLRAVADIYVPFGLYQVTVSRRSRRDVAILGLDAVTGALDLYRFEDVPRSDDVMEVRTRNHVEPVLSRSAADDILVTRVMRMMYHRVGFLAVGGSHVDVQPVEEALHVPYWAGFFGRGEAASLVVVDAVRRQIEGVKVRRLIAEWIRQARAD